jgi:hypothetical protein
MEHLIILHSYFGLESQELTFNITHNPAKKLEDVRKRLLDKKVARY